MVSLSRRQLSIADPGLAFSTPKRGKFGRACTVLLDTLSTPLAKTGQLYGLSSIPGPVSRLSERNESFVKEHGIYGKAVSALGWVPVGLGLTALGAFAAGRLSMLGGTLSDSIGYTLAGVHPCLVSLAIKASAGKAGIQAGMQRYFEANSVTDIPASATYISLLSIIIHSGVSSHVSVGHGICAVVASSLAAFTIWMAGFTAYWARIVRREQGESAWESIKQAGKGFLSGLKPWKLPSPQSACEEAGMFAGVGFVVWALPFYAIRCASAAIVALSGAPVDEFFRQYLGIVTCMGWLGDMLTGVKLSLVDEIIKRRNNALDGE